MSINITDLNVTNVNYIQNTSPIRLHDDFITLDLKNLTLNSTLKYGYVLDPPIAADLGDAYIDISNFDLTTNLSIDWYDDGISLGISNITFGFEAFDLFLDGYSDLSEVLDDLISSIIDFVSHLIVAKIDNSINEELPQLV